jgi:MFS family permease
MIMSTPDSVSGLLVPLFGIWIDKVGKRCSLMAVCAILVGLAHCALACVPANQMHPLVAMIPLGIAYALYGTALWPAIAGVVQDPQVTATAYGVATSALNASLTIAPMVVAGLLVHSSETSGVERYAPVEGFFVSLSVIAFIASIKLFQIDAQQGGKLERPTPKLCNFRSELSLEVGQVSDYEH